MDQTGVRTVVANEPNAVPTDLIGSIESVPVVAILQKLTGEQRSGDLQVCSGAAVKTVYLDEGLMVFAASSMASDRLGVRLVGQGKVTLHDVERAHERAQREDKRLGTALVSAGLLSEEEIGRQVVLQIEHIILSLFPLTNGLYSFDERDCIIPGELRVANPAHEILLRGARSMENARMVIAALPPLTTIVRGSERATLRSVRAELKDVERAVLDSTGEGASLEAVTARVGGDGDVVLRACLGLLAARHLEMVRVLDRPRAVDSVDNGASQGHERPLGIAGGAPWLNDSDRRVESPVPPSNSAWNATWDEAPTEQLLRDARLHIDTREWAGAVQLLCKLVERSPDAAEYHLLLANAMSRIKTMRRTAERHYQEALRLQPGNPEIHVCLGLYYRASGVQGRAAAEFRSALAIDPKHPGARRGLEGHGKRETDTVTALLRKFLPRS